MKTRGVVHECFHDCLANALSAIGFCYNDPFYVSLGSIERIRRNKRCHADDERVINGEPEPTEPYGVTEAVEVYVFRPFGKLFAESIDHRHFFDDPIELI